MIREQIAQILWIQFPDSDVLAIYDAADVIKAFIIEKFGPPF